MEVSDQWVNNFDRIQNITTAGDHSILHKILREHERTKEAFYYLNDHKKLKGGQYGKGYDQLEELINNRYFLISDYAEERMNKFHKALNAEEKEVKKEIERRKEEGISNIEE